MVINQLSLQNKKGFYVGDSETDILSAIDNGISPIYLSDQLDYSIIKNYKLLENKGYFKELYHFGNLKNNNKLMKSPKFENLFVLELANNHWGNLERGLKIIHDFGSVVKHNNVKAAIKFQIRDVDNFVHSNYKTTLQDIFKKL